MMAEGRGKIAASMARMRCVDVAQCQSMGINECVSPHFSASITISSLST